MAASFKGWGGSWGQTWDRISDPNAMYGSASFAVSAAGTLTGIGSTNEMQGTAGMQITATATISATGSADNAPSWNPFATDGGFIVPRLRLQIKDKRRSKKRRDNEVLFLSH